MADRRVAADETARQVGDLYGDAQARLEKLVREALERGATGTADYRSRQLARIVALLSELQDRAVPLSTAAASEAYSAALAAVESSLPGPGPAFSGVHQQAVEVLADNLVNRLNEAAQTVGRNVEDAFRRAALREAAVGVATGSARREVSAQLVRRLVEDGVTDALTGFVDRAGKRWPLEAYSKMAVRTTTREAVTQGTVNRLLERQADLVTISHHATSCEVCQPFDGKTYSLSGRTRGHPVLKKLPPFHPNCRHVLTPAAGNLDAFEAALQA